MAYRVHDNKKDGVSHGGSKTTEGFEFEISCNFGARDVTWLSQNLKIIKNHLTMDSVVPMLQWQ